MTFERSEISLAVEQNANQYPGLWNPGLYADHLAEAKKTKKAKARPPLIEEARPGNTMAFLSRGSRTGQMTDMAEDDAFTGGFNRHQKLMSPQTRELVLRARSQEIEAFADDRGLNPQIVMAIAEVSSRMGRVPDLRQYGVYGDDAKAIHHFIAGDVLNLALEDEQPSASILSEAATNDPERVMVEDLTEIEYAKFYKGPKKKKKSPSFDWDKAEKTVLGGGYKRPKKKKKVVPGGEYKFADDYNPLDNEKQDKKAMAGAKAMLSMLDDAQVAHLKQTFPHYLAFLEAAAKGRSAYEKHAKIIYKQKGANGRKAMGQMRIAFLDASIDRKVRPKLFAGMPKPKPAPASAPAPGAASKTGGGAIPVTQEFSDKLMAISSKALRTAILIIVKSGIPSSGKPGVKWKVPAAQLKGAIQIFMGGAPGKGAHVVHKKAAGRTIIQTPVGDLNLSKTSSNIGFFPKKELLAADRQLTGTELLEAVAAFRISARVR